METVGAPAQAQGYRWVVISVWLTASVTAFMITSSLGILLPAISAELRLTPSQQGLLSSAAFWGHVALAVPLSWWASRFGAKVLTTVTLVLGALFLFLQAWSPTLVVLLLGRLGFGITVIARQPAQALLMHQWFPRREVVLVNSISNALFGLVVGGGIAAAPFILEGLAGNWRATMSVFGGLFAALTVLWAVLGRERVAAESRLRRPSGETDVLKGALRHRDLWVASFGFFGSAVAWSGFLSFYPTMMLDTYQVSLRWSGAILGLTLLGGGVAGLAFSYAVMGRVRAQPIILASGALMAATFVGMTLTGSVPWLLALSLLNGVAWGFWPVLFSVPFHLPGIRPREVAVALSVQLMVSSSGIALGPLLTGIMQEALGDLRLSLLTVGFAALSLCVAGALLKSGAAPAPEPAAGGAAPEGPGA